MSAEIPTSTAIRKLTPGEEARRRVATEVGDNAAFVEAGKPGATAESIERARAAKAGMAEKALATTIDDSVLTEGRAAERARSAQYWRDKATEPGVSDEDRQRFLREAELVQREADSHAGVTDPNVRPEGYQSPSEKEIEDATERVQSMRRN